ncbi:MAG: hypothetical protein U9P61_02155, partial [Patescibacteria group bacterium]|nr:hypothetical protein [Patescibacteria group bacterium]
DEGDAEITDVTVKVDTATLDADVALARLRLYVDGTFIEEATSFDSDNSHSEAFEIDYIALGEDETVEIEVVIDVYGEDVLSEGEQITATLENVTAVDAEENSIEDDNERAGKTQYLYTAVPEFELTDSGIERTDARDVADAYLTFEVTAVGGDIYLGSTLANALVFATYSGVTNSTWSVDIAVGGDYTDGGTYYLIEKTETMTFDVVGDIGVDSTTNGSTFVRLELENFVWGHASDGLTGQTWSQDDWEAVDEMETDRLSVYLGDAT